MPRATKKPLLIAFTVGVVAIVAVISAPFVLMSVDVWSAKRHRAQILYKTDHQSLLAACRQIMTNRQSFARDMDWHGPHDLTTSYIDAHDPKIPAVIAKLNPVDLVATDSHVEVALSRGFDHYGVIAISEEAERSASKEFGGLKLISGLWYYDENLVQNHATWLEQLKKMKPRGVPTPAWQITDSPRP